MKPLLEYFEQLKNIAEGLGDKEVLASVLEAMNSYQERKFIVAAVGEFKRGKSSLLNAILGIEIFPVGVLPLTSVITMAEHGEDGKAEVYFSDGRTATIELKEIPAYVTEEGNEGNRKGVRAVLVEVDSPLLKTGMRLVDTPGIGSVISENSAVAKEFIPHVDVALAVSGYEPPITGEELDILRKLSKEASRIVIVLNKNDLAGDKAREAIHSFTLAALRRNEIRADEIVSSSSLAPSADDGVARLRKLLAELCGGSSEEIIREAALRNIRRAASSLLQAAELHSFALKEPGAAIDKKLRDFHESVADLDIWIIAAKKRAEKAFRIDENRLDELASELREEAEKELAASDYKVISKSKIIRAAKEKAKAIAKSKIERFRKQAEDYLAEIDAGRLAALQKEFDDIRRRIHKAGAESFGVSFSESFSDPFRMETAKLVLDFSEKGIALDLSFLVDRIFNAVATRTAVYKRAEAEAGRMLKDWLRENFGRISQRFVNELDSLTRHRNSAFEEGLRETARRISRAVENGRELKRKSEIDTAPELLRLEGMKTRLLGVLNECGLLEKEMDHT